MPLADPHHHLWDLTALHYPWLLENDKTAFFGSYSSLSRNYLPENYRQDAAGQDLQKSVHIQAEADPSDPVAETSWLAGLSGAVPNAIVAFVDFRADDVDSILSQHCEYEQVRGIRQILNYHTNASWSYTDEDLLENEKWHRNFSLIGKHGLSFDLQIYYQQMTSAAKLAARHSDIQFILNHTGMPVERSATAIQGWRDGMRQLAACENVVVKISGLGMAQPTWTAETIRPFVLDTIDYFGVERCMFASNFPVDGLFSDFGTLFDAYRAITASFSADEQGLLFHDNTVRIYQI